MEAANKIYLCIDLKSFYASVECVERGLDPFEVNLVVADPDRGGGAITLAATPAIKKLGVPSRGRIYEIPEGIEYIIAKPRMHLYMEYSTKIYSIFLKHIAPEDIHVYSIDEAFLDVTPYLELYGLTPKQLARKILDDIYNETGITATVGIGTNLFLTKVALDITAKHTPDNMGYLDEELFRQQLWHHTPLTDIWMIGVGTANHLARLGITDLYGITQFPEYILYREFGINAEILIDHAWGKEPVEIKDIKSYRPKANSISNSQLLFEDYNYKDAYLILKEMVDTNVLTLTEKHLVTDHISLFIGYSKDKRKASRGSCKITNRTNSYRILMEEFRLLFQKIVDPNYPIRQIGISLGNVRDEIYEQYDLFADFEEIEKERKLQQTLVDIRNKFGKNAVLKGMNFLDKGTARYRNTTIGGHKA
ncbi:DNA repair protein [Faecalicoccus pleomorphus]|uniref:Y-family DNA polymerase n=1 Tax=Faecalicoccus pleomorphus TaxID=1323 RepID=UPI00232D9C9D|nr:DNA repair protein [Faecalicoccus pleomorphus]MDB7987077.1 DNA repair protein [Faecalicoccus pleomorphus]MDB7992097.1 DNA repair protein [Faecalicoccus pleomorphus]